MRGILLLTQAEISRLRRNRRYLIFTVGMPVVLYLIFSKAGILWEAVAGSVRSVRVRRWTCADLIILPQGQTILTYRNQMTNGAGCTPPTSPMSHRRMTTWGRKLNYRRIAKCLSVV